MPEAWKSFETESAALIDGERYWANSGEEIDVESDYAVGQCKLVKVMSLNELTKLAEAIATHADAHEETPDQPYKIGMVFTKVRRGRGKTSAPLVCMTFEQFEKLKREWRKND